MKVSQPKKKQKIAIDCHYDDLKESIQILRKLKKTVDSDGTYCPFNKTYPHQADVAHRIRQILREEIEV